MAEVNKWMIDPNDAVMLLIDHQSGLFQLVKDIDLPRLRANVTALAQVSQARQAPDLHHGLGARRPERPAHP